MIDQIIEYNKTFVAQKGYKSHRSCRKTSRCEASSSIRRQGAGGD